MEKLRHHSNSKLGLRCQDKMAIPSGYTVLKLPRWILFIRIAQAAVALIAFGLLCYGESISSFDADGLMLFTVSLLPLSIVLFAH